MRQTVILSGGEAEAEESDQSRSPAAKAAGLLFAFYCMTSYTLLCQQNRPGASNETPHSVPSAIVNQ